MATRSVPLTFAALVAGTAIAIAAISPRPIVLAGASGAIRGRVEVRQPSMDGGPRVTVAELGMSSAHEPPDRRSVVYLDPAPRAAFDTREDVRPRMGISQRALSYYLAKHRVE